MSLPAAVTPVILDTILGHLAAHFLADAKGDLAIARHAVSHVLAAYGAETEEELRLAAEVIGFGFHALEALGEAAASDLPAAEKISLLGGAVRLSREAHRSQRRLDQLRHARAGALLALQGEQGSGGRQAAAAVVRASSACARMAGTRPAITGSVRPDKSPFASYSDVHAGRSGTVLALRLVAFAEKGLMGDAEQAGTA